MGIVNVTPDSFSDGGRFLSHEAAVAHGLALVRQGADILDIGGESTRPGAVPVPVAEERRRVIPVIRRLAAEVGIPISVDTLKPEVAEEALAAGASIVNDVGANREDPALWRLVAGAGAGYVAMHMQGSPATMQTAPSYDDVTNEVLEFFRTTLVGLAREGVSADHVVLDVGIGFGKALEHNLELLARLATFTQLRRPLMLGVSRKSFLGRLTGAATNDRLPGALAASCLGRIRGVDILRTHDVVETAMAVKVTEAILAYAQDSNG